MPRGGSDGSDYTRMSEKKKKVMSQMMMFKV
jgi:hypothetical protein